MKCGALGDTAKRGDAEAHICGVNGEVTNAAAKKDAEAVVGEAEHAHNIDSGVNKVEVLEIEALQAHSESISPEISACVASRSL